MELIKEISTITQVKNDAELPVVFGAAGLGVDLWRLTELSC